MYSSVVAYLPSLIATYGYWLIALLIGLESMGLPLPGEAALIAAAIYAGSTHRLDIGLVILAATLGAVIGDNIGFWIGREAGYRLLIRHGRRVGITERKIKLGRYMFLRHGGKVVFFGRFVTVLRSIAALLAGASHMAWGRFFLFNFSGAIVWTTTYGLAANLLGNQISRILWSIDIVGIALLIVVFGTAALLLRHHHRRLQAAAERAFPGPL